jgi:hypothetical protein
LRERGDALRTLATRARRTTIRDSLLKLAAQHDRAADVIESESPGPE